MGKEAVLVMLLLFSISGCSGLNPEKKADEFYKDISPPQLPAEDLSIENNTVGNDEIPELPSMPRLQEPFGNELAAPVKLNIPEEIEQSCIGFKIGSLNKTGTVSGMGVGWVNMNWPKFRWGSIERAPGVYDFSEHDLLVKAAQKDRLVLFAELLPYADWDQGGDSKCRAKEHDYLCKPKDMEAYKKFVSRLIERYDGDGEDDMPGLEIPVKYWSIISEPDIKKDPYVIFFVGDEQDYLEVIRESYVTIKEACEDCKIVQGAAAGIESEFMSFWDKFFSLGGAEYFDIADVHYVGINIATGGTVGLGDKSTLNAKTFRELLAKHKINKPLWVSEAVIRTSDAESSLRGALESGVSKVFFVESQHSTLEQYGSLELTKLCKN
ncbi:hypothetical protein HYU11_03085 [Candidatus Woesearchaeota archaeon]|nr:hypothetical protein [Candidatus Woesearchaeota archaeon]